MKRAVAYCRVSTNKEEQLDSLESQQRFFEQYAIKNDFSLDRIYADEGKSGTKIKNRIQLLQLLSDAELNEFEIVLIKDVSRLARNTVDFLTSIRKLKMLGIKVIFVNYDQTSSDSSEFMLTMLSAIAQEESANTSKRVKFGKRQNAEKGKVPNLIYGYDKINGELFNLQVNEEEAEVVRRIFGWYTEQDMGTNKIAKELNELGIKTKRGCNWTQCGITRILSNEIYIGKVINRKEEVVDFLTGTRTKVKEEDRFICNNPQLKIIDDMTFEKANRILESRKLSFRQSSVRESDKHVFSKLIYCKYCGAAFRRVVRSYKNTYIRWVCSGRNSLGVETCKNNVAIEEDELIGHIRDYFQEILNHNPQAIQRLINEYNRRMKSIGKEDVSMEAYRDKINRLAKMKEKYIELYQNEIISIHELKEFTDKLKVEETNIKKDVDFMRFNKLIQNPKDDAQQSCLESVLLTNCISNSLLKKIINKIIVDEDQNINVYIKLF